MSSISKSWPEIYSIGNSCIERYVNSKDVQSPLEDHDIIAAGLSELAGLYDISRSSFIAHVVIITVDGCGQFETPDSQRLLNPGEIMLIPAGIPARYRIKGDSWNIIWFDLANVEQWRWLNKAGVSVNKVTNTDALYFAMDALYDEIHSQQLESEALANLLVKQIIIYLKRALAFEASYYERRTQTRLNRLFQQVNRQLQIPWNVEKLAMEASFSQSHLYALCRMHLGVKPMKYVTQMRMQRAGLLLYQTNAPIADIANTVGYQNQFNFSSAFKKHSGLSPSKYRTRSRGSGVFQPLPE